MTDQKDNYIPDEDASHRRPAMPNRPADEGDEDVLASIARQHASRHGLKQAGWVSPEPLVVRPAEPPVMSEAEMLVSSEVEMPLRKPIDLRDSCSGDVFMVRRARRKSPHKSALGESARRLIIHLTVVAALTGLAVAMYFLTRG